MTSSAVVVRVHAGWRDAHVLQLLRLFRQHAPVYLYGGNERFAAVARAESLYGAPHELPLGDRCLAGPKHAWMYVWYAQTSRRRTSRT